MSTFKEIIYSIKENLRQYSDDSDISLEYVGFLVKNTRAMLIAQRYSDRKYAVPNKIRSHFYKTLELTNDNEFTEATGTILRTQTPLLPILEHHNFITDIRVTSGSYNDSQFTFVPASRFAYIGENKWLQSQIYVCLGTDNRLYFKSSNPVFKALDQVKVSYVAEDPEACYPQTVEYDENIDFWDMDYKLEEAMVSQLTDIIVKKLAGMLQMKEDNQNDSNSENA